MAIKFNCPHCGRSTRVADEYGGKKAKCPGCQSAIMVPAASAESEANAPTKVAFIPAGATFPAEMPPLPSGDGEWDYADVFFEEYKMPSSQGLPVRKLMPIKIKCSGCGKSVNVPEKYAGKKVKCPGCQAAITVPVASAASTKSEANKPDPSLPLTSRTQQPLTSQVVESSPLPVLRRMKSVPLQPTPLRDEDFDSYTNQNLDGINLLAIPSFQEPPEGNRILPRRSTTSGTHEQTRAIVPRKTCWYCKHSHVQAAQCPYCHMLAHSM